MCDKVYLMPLQELWCDYPRRVCDNFIHPSETCKPLRSSLLRSINNLPVVRPECTASLGFAYLMQRYFVFRQESIRSAFVQLLLVKHHEALQVSRLEKAVYYCSENSSPRYLPAVP